ncbi:uncharacterized protein CEXT_429011 [Caerostris extrusa]|uniref:CUB domain-containing protein n=1 Tax=Caerostris extrusa TaxID=172846 RepID=A0AAV4S4N7_CAEEX|nr:uncharacterized protein CEXT_429011 [Caerostris extrusa]
MGILMLVYILLLEYISFSIYQADAIIYLEDTCFPGQSKYLQIAVDEPYESEISYVEYIFASRTGTYSAGINCTVRISSGSSYDVILNVKKIRYIPGCEDYLQIFDGVKVVGLCGFKDEHDSNMQFYGKEFLLHYFTGSETSQVLGLNGFSLSLTISRKSLLCGRFRCSNDYCIDSHFVCDSTNNCGDFSDERSCGSSDVTPAHFPGAVVVIAMCLVGVMGLVGGFCLSICMRAVWGDIVRIYFLGRNEADILFFFCRSYTSPSSRRCVFC